VARIGDSDDATFAPEARSTALGRPRRYGRNHALPTMKYTAVVPGLCATSMSTCNPNFRASSYRKPAPPLARPA
jgi:hypothetical protein